MHPGNFSESENFFALNRPHTQDTRGHRLQTYARIARVPTSPPPHRTAPHRTTLPLDGLPAAMLKSLAVLMAGGVMGVYIAQTYNEHIPDLKASVQACLDSLKGVKLPWSTPKDAKKDDA